MLPPAFLFFKNCQANPVNNSGMIVNLIVDIFFANIFMQKHEESWKFHDS